jgi:hypothetical protein
MSHSQYGAEQTRTILLEKGFIRSMSRAGTPTDNSYDELLQEQLGKHLSLLSRQELISEWYNRQIFAGTEWEQEIDERLETASIILLLISANFLASDYCYNVELNHVLERYQRGEARVIPIILRPCDWRVSRFAHLQCLSRSGRAVTTWQNLRIEAFSSPKKLPCSQF